MNEGGNVSAFFFLLGRKAIRVLESMISESGVDVAFVCVAGDRGVQDDAREEIIELCQANAIRHFARHEMATQDLRADYSCAIGWRWLLNDVPNLVVLHDSPLPRYRGFAPVVNMLIAGETQLGVTALKPSAKCYDAGPVLAQKCIPIIYPVRVAVRLGISSLSIPNLCSKFLHLERAMKIARERFKTSAWRALAFGGMSATTC